MGAAVSQHEPSEPARSTREPLLTAALRRERLVLIVVLVGLPLMCWLWLIAMARDMYGSMSGPSAGLMTSVWDTAHVIVLWAMWAAMMAGMMLPSATPLLLLYAGAARMRSNTQGALWSVYRVGGGYLAVWGIFSVGATLLQRLFATRFLLTPMMEPATPVMAAVLLILTGAYQLSPLKLRCLTACRSPLNFLMSHWKGGTKGAFRLGVVHGLYCLGCCWALMLLLFAGGVMNLAVILALTVWIILEKTAPFGVAGARVSGALLIAAGGWMLLR